MAAGVEKGCLRPDGLRTFADRWITIRKLECVIHDRARVIVGITIAIEDDQA